MGNNTIRRSAYFDESGTHQGSSILVAAAYVSTEAKWKRFERELARLFRRERIEGPYHHVDFENRRDACVDWDNARRVRFIQDLISAIKVYKALGVSVAVNVADYAVSGWDRLYSAYGFCVVECMHYIARWADTKSIAGPIAYVFEDGAEHRGDISRAMGAVRADCDLTREFRLGSWRFGTKQGELPLAAADVLAYETWKYITNTRPPAPPVRPERRSLRRLLDRHHVGTYYDAKKLHGLSQNYLEWKRRGRSF